MTDWQLAQLTGSDDNDNNDDADDDDDAAAGRSNYSAVYSSLNTQHAVTESRGKGATVASQRQRSALAAKTNMAWHQPLCLGLT